MRTAIAALVFVCASACAQSLPGTQPLTERGDFADRMVSGMDRFLLRELAASPDRRARQPKQAAQSRERFRRIIGLRDERVPFASLSLLATLERPALVGEGRGYKIYAVRWPVLDGVDAEGLLLEPAGTPVARVVALPDADWTPEMLAGLEPGVAPAAQFARRLAENGCRVLVPALIDRQPTRIVNPRIPRPTNQTRREFIYRMGFEMGRHIAGYEVQKVLAAVDWFAASRPARPIGVIGYGEGGLLALYSAVADTRIGAAAVSGYFGPREGIWKEPVYRNVWGLLAEFGDAEIAGLVAPRALVIENSRGPEIAGPPPQNKENGNGAAPGALTTPDAAGVLAEFNRAKSLFEKAGAGGRLTLAASRDGQAEPGSDACLRAFLSGLGVPAALRPAGAVKVAPGAAFDAASRQRRQFDQLINFTQGLVQRSESTRKQFWSKADASSVERWNATKELYRRYLWDEVFGRLPAPSEPLTAQTRILYDRPNWTGHEVALPLWPDVFAYGVLLVPKDLKPGERRPVVVAQHGRAGRPQDLIEPEAERTANVYKKFAAQLADRGFIVYAPQNPYIFEERYRYIQRKANPLKLSLFSFILSQHQRTLEWLAQLPFVDPKRIAFYGLSYGGKTAVRVPPLLDGYALSICSGDFNEYAGKMASTERTDSFMFTIEHEMYEFDLGNTFNYSDMANLMAPRPFMVERGHKDGVGLDEWVAYEYAKVRRFYAFLGIPERTAIEFFNGVHEIHAEETFRFLHRQLGWPER